MEVVHSPEMLVNVYKTTQCHNTEQHDQHFYCSENFSYQTEIFFSLTVRVAK
jgi:hypothetical protein